jgi:hypothetical protein
VAWVATVIGIGLELFVIFYDPVPAPAFGAGSLPFLEIARHAADRYHRIDRRAAAHDAALVIGKGGHGIRIVVGQGLPLRHDAGPRVPAVIDGAVERIADLCALIAGVCVAPGFQQQHPVGRHLAQPCRHDRTRGSAADDDVVPRVVPVLRPVLHLVLHPVLWPVVVPARHVTSL